MIRDTAFPAGGSAEPNAAVAQFCGFVSSQFTAVRRTTSVRSEFAVQERFKCMEAFWGDLQKRKAEAKGGIRVKEDVEEKGGKRPEVEKVRKESKMGKQGKLKNGERECATNKGVNLC